MNFSLFTLLFLFMIFPLKAVANISCTVGFDKTLGAQYYAAPTDCYTKYNGTTDRIYGFIYNINNNYIGLSAINSAAFPHNFSINLGDVDNFSNSARRTLEGPCDTSLTSIPNSGSSSILSTNLSTYCGYLKTTDNLLMMQATRDDSINERFKDVTITVNPLPSISYSNTTFTESGSDDGTITTTATLTLSGDTFTGSNNDDWSSLVSNVPAGLTAVLIRTGDTTASLSFTGNALEHTNAADISNLTVTFTDGYFTGGDASAITNAVKNDLVMDFIITEISYSATTFTEANADDGSIDTTATLTLSGDTFTNIDSGAWSSIVTNVPTGLTAVLTRTSDTTASLSFTGNADSHLYVDNIANLTITFTDNYFSGGNASAITNAVKSDLSVDFSTTCNATSGIFDDLFFKGSAVYSDCYSKIYNTSNFPIIYTLVANNTLYASINGNRADKFTPQATEKKQLSESIATITAIKEGACDSNIPSSGESEFKVCILMKLIAHSHRS